MPNENENNETIPVNAQPPATQDKAEPQEPELLAGKFKSADELATAYSELENRFGQQGSELGELRKTVNTLTDQIANNQPGKESGNGDPADPAEQEFDYNAEMDAILKQIDDGELSVEEGMRASSALTAKLVESMSEAKAAAAIQQMQQENDAQSIQQRFFDENPDFTELQQNGTLAKIRESNPLHDDLSAYYAYKAISAREEGKAELERLQKGADPAAQAAMGPGTAIRQQSTRPGKVLSDREMSSSMMQALQKARGAAA